MEEEKKVIILNKPFLGGWLNEEGRIGHEIIDFFLADNGKYYVYNNPWGVCPDDIWVGDRDKNDYGLVRTDKEQYVAKYMVLTSGAHTSVGKKNGEDDSSKKTFNILYIIELKAKIHRYNTGSDKNKGLAEGQKNVASVIEEKEIKYNKKSLVEIYGEDDSLYLTFEANKNSVYKVKDGKILSFTPKKYNFQRNKGYLKSEGKDDKDCKEDYETLNKLIEDEIQKVKDGKDCILEKVTLTPLLPDRNAKNYKAEKTFLDLIAYTDSEQAFTNMLHALLKNSEVFKKFCKEFKKDGAYFAEDVDFKVEREKKVENGRMDISGESKTQNVIMENKIDSGLNGLDEKAHTSQLSTYYYKWGKVEGKEEPLCFITAPDYRKAEIEAEINKFDSGMENIYKIVTYGEIADFIEKNKTLFEDDKLISLLYNQIVNAFRKWSYKSREDLYADLFLKATKDSNNA